MAKSAARAGGASVIVDAVVVGGSVVCGNVVAAATIVTCVHRRVVGFTLPLPLLRRLPCLTPSERACNYVIKHVISATGDDVKEPFGRAHSGAQPGCHPLECRREGTFGRIGHEYMRSSEGGHLAVGCSHQLAQVRDRQVSG